MENTVRTLGLILWPLVVREANSGVPLKKRADPAGWIKYLVNPATIKYNECTYTIDIEQNLEDSKEKVDKVSD